MTRLACAGLCLLVLVQPVFSAVQASQSISDLQQTTIDQSGLFSRDKPGWYGHEAWIERALLEGTVVDLEQLSVGTTKPWRVDLEWARINQPPLRLSAVFKPIERKLEPDHRDSYQTEIAAYRLSRYLELDRVPPTVVRKIGKETGSLQLWISGVRSFSKALDSGDQPDTAVYRREATRMKLFDALLRNSDRNSGNFLVTDSWHLVLIDHSRALMPPGPKHRHVGEIPVAFDDTFIAHLQELNTEILGDIVGDVLGKNERKFLLHQRDRILREVKALKRTRVAGLCMK